MRLRLFCALNVVAYLAVCGSVRAQSFVRVADTMTPIPGGAGAFTSFDPSVVAASFFPVTREVSFRAFGAGQEGIYCFDGAGLSRIADRNTAVPGATGTFETFDAPSGVGGVMFRAAGASRHGIYFVNASGVAQAVDSAPISQGSYGRVSKGYSLSANAYLRNGQVVSNGGAGSINFTPAGYSFVSPDGDPDVGVFDVFVRATYFGPGFGTGIFMGGNNSPAPARVIDAGPGGQMDDVSAGLGGTVAAIIRGGPNDGLNLAFPRGTSRGDGYESVVLVRPGDPLPSGRGTSTNFRSVAAGGLENVVPSKILGAFLAESEPGKRESTGSTALRVITP
jgi:hypothetical protein